MANLYQAQETVQTSSLYWPNSQKIRDQLSLPLTLSLQPLTPQTPLASFSGNNIGDYRCHSCKAFINYLCEFRNSNEYDCSICGCSNRLNKKVKQDSIEMKSHVYECQTQNPTNRVINIKERTYAFVIDVTNYGKYCYQFVRYSTHLIKELTKQVDEENDTNLLFIIFDDYMTYYYREEDDEVGKLKNTHLQELRVQNCLFSVKKHLEQIQQILEDIEREVLDHRQNPVMKMPHSKGLLHALHEGLKFTQNQSGKLFLISGISSVPQTFKKGLENEPQNWKDNYSLNMKKCIPQKTLQLIKKTYISINIFVYSCCSVTLLPFYCMTKLTNGILRIYNPINYEMFFYELQQNLCIEEPYLATESILKVRHSAGLKLVGIFGQYRTYKNLKDQIEMLSCPSTRKYIFEFIIQGKIHQPFVNIQFSVLWTNKYGKRIFKVITFQNKVSSDCKQILQYVNYKNICQSYLQAVYHNLDLNAKPRVLQLTLQERCKNHLQAIKKYIGDLQKENMKEIRPYIILTFLMMRHFTLTTKPQNSFLYDQAVEMRSRALTSDEGLHSVWPVVYSINNDGSKIVQMKREQVLKSEVGIIANQGDFSHFYIADEKIRKKVVEEYRSTRTDPLQIIKKYEELKNMVEVVQEIRNEKISGFTQICFFDNAEAICILDEEGPLSFQNFLQKVMNNQP